MLANAVLITPLAIVFEVYKWLVYHVSIPAARLALATMRQSLDVVALDADEIELLEALWTPCPGGAVAWRTRWWRC